MPRRYTDAKLDAYELRPVGDKVIGVTVRYEVWIGGGVLGYIRRSVRPRSWQAYTTTGTSPSGTSAALVWHARAKTPWWICSPRSGCRKGLNRGFKPMGTPQRIVV